MTETPETTSAPPNWIKRHRALSITAGALALLLIGGGTTGAVLLTQESARQDAIQGNRDAVATFTATRALANSGTAEISLLVGNAAAASTTLTDTLTTITGYVAGDVNDGLAEGITILDEEIAAIAETRGLDPHTGAPIAAEDAPAPVRPVQLVAVDDTTSEADAHIATQEAEALTAPYLEQIAADSKVAATIRAHISDTITLLEPVAESVEESAATVIKNHPSAAKASIDAFTTAASAVLAADLLDISIATDNIDTDSPGTSSLTTIAGLLNDYGTTGKALVDSHNAALAAAAAEAARVAAEEAANRGESSYQDPATGNWVETPGYGGGGNSGGGGGGGNSGGGGGGGDSGGGGGGGGDSGGGGGGGDSGGGGGGGDSGGGGGDNGWRPLSVSPGGSACTYDGGQEVTYGSTLMPPADSTWTTYEIPGYGWGLTWFCTGGW